MTVYNYILQYSIKIKANYQMIFRIGTMRKKRAKKHLKNNFGKGKFLNFTKFKI